MKLVSSGQGETCEGVGTLNERSETTKGKNRHRDLSEDRDRHPDPYRYPCPQCQEGPGLPLPRPKRPKDFPAPRLRVVRHRPSDTIRGSVLLSCRALVVFKTLLPTDSFTSFVCVCVFLYVYV